MRTATYYLEGRYTVTIECADDLTRAERAGMEEWFRKEVGFLQRVDGPPLFTEAQERAFAAALAAMDPAEEAAGDRHRAWIPRAVPGGVRDRPRAARRVRDTHLFRQRPGGRVLVGLRGRQPGGRDPGRRRGGGGA